MVVNRYIRESTQWGHCGAVVKKLNSKFYSTYDVRTGMKMSKKGMNSWMWMATRKKKSRQMKAAIAEMTATTAKTAKTRMRADSPASNHTVYLWINTNSA